MVRTAKNAPKAKIMPLKAFQNRRAHTSDVIRAIQYAEANGATIVNCSWGSTEDNPALKDVMEDSTMLFVCAAGNYHKDFSQEPIYPAAYNFDHTVSVASINDSLGITTFSNYGAGVDIAAPGRKIESTYPNGEYGLMEGTSVSAGFVSAAIANYAGTVSRSAAAEQKAALKENAGQLSCLIGKTENGNYLGTENLVKQEADTFVEPATETVAEPAPEAMLGQTP